MAAQAAHIVDKVLPNVPVRQWVVSFPYELRMLLAKQSDVLSAVLRIVMSLVLSWYVERGKELGISEPKTGGINVLQRFGGSLNFNPHVHMIMMDGVFVFHDEQGDEATFHPFRAPTKRELSELVHRLSRRISRMLRSRGLINDSPDQEQQEDNGALDACRKVSLRKGRFGFVDERDERGNSQQQLFPELNSYRKSTSPTCADLEGYSLEAGVWMPAVVVGTRSEEKIKASRERLLRYCLRGPLGSNRLSRLSDGSIAYRTKYGRGNRTHLVMSPVEFLARMASLVPPARRALLRYFGILAPNSPYRRIIVPKHNPETRPKPSSFPTSSKPKRPKGKSNKPSNTRCLDEIISSGTNGEPEPVVRTSRYIDWATLMKRTFGIDVLQCPKCESNTKMTVIAVISRRDVVNKILSHVQLPLSPETLSDGYSVAYEVSPEEVPTWVEGTFVEEEGYVWERGPPREWEGVDPPYCC
jgi:hypothetical protein